MVYFLIVKLCSNLFSKMSVENGRYCDLYPRVLDAIIYDDMNRKSSKYHLCLEL